ncbi:MAG TPA: NAD-dependent epimerase/dehydratase family protein [Pirellulaceae bacterium]|nr:NAD-dependent epimerase/dehydratase family protein [Pirellulaceae bacterium]
MPTGTESEDRWIFGAGYLGLRVASLWRGQGARVHLVTRSPDKAARWATEGYLTHVADLRHPMTLDFGPSIAALLWAVGFDRQGTESIVDVQVGGVRHLLDALTTPPRVWIQVSTTGVYGGGEGERVDEESPCHPDRDGGRAALEAERLVAGDHRVGSTIILRMAGLYGPGRVPNVEPLRRGEPLAANPDGWLNLVRIEDAVQAVERARIDGRPGCYLVSDGNPVLRRDYYTEVARLAGVGPVAFAPDRMSATKGARATGSKRIDSTRIRRELGFRPDYPDYRVGLADLFG